MEWWLCHEFNEYLMPGIGWGKRKRQPGEIQVGVVEGGGESGVQRPFLESRVPTVAPWRALNFGFDLQMTYRVPLRFTTWQSAWRRLAEEREDRTFMGWDRLDVTDCEGGCHGMNQPQTR